MNKNMASYLKITNISSKLKEILIKKFLILTNKDEQYFLHNKNEDYMQLSKN